MFNPNAFENSRPDGISLLEILDPEHGEEQPRHFVPLQRTEMRGEISGPLASLRLSQLFRFSHGQCDKILEAVYRFPLPGDAAVTGVRVRFGDVDILAELQERHQAEGGYREAKEKGWQAALLTFWWTAPGRGRRRCLGWSFRSCGIDPGRGESWARDGA